MKTVGLYTLLICSLLLSCDSKLSDEQRKALKQEMEDREIRKLGEKDVYQATMKAGQQIMGQLTSDERIEELIAECDCTIKFTVSEEDLEGKEAELYELYSQSPDAGENVQKDGDLYLIYTRPEMAGDTLSRLWIIRFKRKNIVLSL